MTYTIRVQRRNVDRPTMFRWQWHLWEQAHNPAVANGISHTKFGAHRAAQRYARRHHRRKHHFDAQTATYTINI